MIFSWLRQRRRRLLLAQPFPDDWLRYLEKNVAHYRFLSEAEKAKLRDDLRIFLAEKYWEGCGGLRITEEIQVTIAAQACLLVLGMEHNYFDRVKTILVYPRGFTIPERSGHFIDEDVAVLGEAHYRGPVILSWSEVLEESREPGSGHNLVMHEFAHQLDMLDDIVNGTPPLPTPEDHKRWQEVMTVEYEKLVRASQRGRATLLDQYGTQDEAEFFAVATECFFDRPVQLSERHPKLYALLRDYFHQDPAARCLP